jgi:sodium/bile acid cotransporter 2
MNKLAASIIMNSVLFLLVMGMAGTLAFEQLRAKFRAPTGIIVGCCCQFLILPLIGFLVLQIFDLEDRYAVTLLLVCSSPGGSYSNWWCSLFNADLALSIAMTTVSTLASLVMLPLNVVLYVKIAYDTEVDIDWPMLFVTVSVVLAAVTAGVAVATHRPTWTGRMNRVGNAAGVVLIVLGAALNTTSSVPVWDHPPRFFLASSLPCLFACALAVGLASCAGLQKPERVAVGIECCYQNTGVAISMVIASMPESDAEAAIGVTVVYQVAQLAAIGCLVLGAWKRGWTFAPPDMPVLATMCETHQPPHHSYNHAAAERIRRATLSRSERAAEDAAAAAAEAARELDVDNAETLQDAPSHGLEMAKFGRQVASATESPGPLRISSAATAQLVPRPLSP